MSESEEKRAVEKEKRKEYRLAARDILLAIWRAVEWDKVSAMRRMKIYDEFASKVQSAALTNDLGRFIKGLCDRMDVRSLSDKRVLEIVEKYLDRELLKCFREDIALIILMLREEQEKRKDNMKPIEEGLGWVKS